jgi:cell division protein FtsI/penicillin-binding protein 2
MLGRTDSPRRLLLLLVGMAVVSGALLLRLGQWQIVQRDALAAQARDQTTIRLEIPARRGSIYDRSGTVLLATTVDRYFLSAAPDQMTAVRRSEVGTEVARMLDLDDAATKSLVERIRQDRPYVILAHDIDETTAERIRQALANGRLEHLALEDEPLRSYPQPGGDPSTTLASHVLGFVNRNGVGQYGVEQYYQDVLAGHPKIVVAQRDANGRAIPDTQSIVDPGTPGTDIRLTIDASLQLALEQELLATWLADQAVTVSAVVMDPYTGEIYAQASAPGYDANDYRSIASSDASRFVDPVISKLYEPGSVFKMLTSVAALERHTVGLMTKVNDSGTLKLDKGKTRVSDADGRPMGWIPFQDIVAYSRNVGVARVALGLGSDLKASAQALYDTWRAFGIGQKTGVDLAGEVSGIARDPSTVPWREVDLANGAFGQGVAVTPMQLATAYSAMVNGGSLLQPHIVSAVGEEAEAPAARADGLVDASLSKSLIGLMNHVVTEVPLYRDRTLVPGYVVGGKTGTAQIWDPSANGGRGAWKKNKFNYSFVGYIGRERPDVIIAVRIEEARPTTIRRGEIELPVMSYELFRRIATNAMTLLDLPARTPADLASVTGGSSDASSQAPAGAP